MSISVRIISSSPLTLTPQLNFVDEYHLIDCFSPLLHTSALLSFELPLSDPLTWFIIITTIVVIIITVIIVTILITNVFVQYIYHHICCNVKPDGDRGDGTVRFNQASCCGRLCEVIWNFQFFTNVHLTSGWNVSWTGQYRINCVITFYVTKTWKRKSDSGTSLRKE